MILASNIKRLANDWHEIFNISPVLAETSARPEKFRGTCYRAAGWEEIGLSKGFTRVPEGFVANKRPKKI